MTIDSSLLEKIKTGEYIDKTLDLSYQNLNLEDIQHLTDTLRRVTTIETLNISGNAIADEGIRLLISDKLSFTTLIAIDCKITFIPFSNNPTNITKLDLANNEMSADGILELSQSEIEWLNCAGNDLDDETGAPIGAMPNIKYLTLSHNRVGAKTCQNIGASKTLLTLHIHNNKLATDAVCSLIKSASITYLGIGGNPVATPAIQAIANNHRLTSLNLANCSFDDTHTLLLANHPTLTHLNVGFNKLTGASAAHFSSNRLISLNLSYNTQQDNGAKILAQHPTLTHLDLTGNGLTFKGGIAFKNNSVLRTLNLNSNRIQDAVVALANNTTLSELFLADNNIGDSAYVFGVNSTLTTLNLSFNHMSDVTTEELKQNCRVKNLLLLTKQPRESMTENMKRIFFFTESPVHILDGITRQILLCNAQYLRTFGYSMNDIQTKSITEFMHPADITPEKDLLDEDKPTYTYENRFRCKDGSYRTMRWTTWFQDDLMYAIGEDLTHYKLVQKQAMLAERNKEDIARYATFISYLSHEIRNPCSGIVSLTDICLEQITHLMEAIKKTAPEHSTEPAISESPAHELTAHLQSIAKEMRECLTDIRDCATIQQEVLDRNLEISKIREGKLKLQKKPFDILSSLQNITKVFKNRARAIELELKVSCEHDTPFWVIGDKTELEQIIINIVSNALKFTKNGGIYINLVVNSCNDKETDFVINVRDTGIGMDEEERNRLFQRFSQANAMTAQEYGGSGLGLHIAQQKALLMNGDISVVSEKGVGTTFSILLKLPTCSIEQIPSDEKLQAMPLRNSASRSSFFSPVENTPLENINILVAEDNSVNQKIMRKKLTSMKYKFTIVGNGKEAYDAYVDGNNHFDVILMDIEMPVMDGITATRNIRKYEKATKKIQIPIIAQTANAMEQDQKRGTDAGMNAYLTKPFVEAALKSAIQHLCYGYRQKLEREVKPEERPRLLA